MTSILTNSGAMNALQSLQSTNKGLSELQGQLSTGKKIASSNDNAAIWAISKTMESDASAFGVINDSLGVAEATVATAKAGAERITDLLRDMKDRAVNATTEGTDFEKVQADVQKKAEEINSVVEGAQMNGINLLKTDIGNGEGTFTALASLDRTNGTATTSANKIEVDSVDFEADLDVGQFIAADATTAATSAITDQATAESAVTAIEGLLDSAISGAASLGSAESNISSQREFVGEMKNALEKGIGSLVDANMEEASARLQALQTQQQLGVQSLSIANQAPQSVLSLFR